MELDFDWWGSPAGAAFVWGLFPRALGLVYIIALGALAYQAVPLSGAYGLSPVKETLRRYRRDFGWKAPFYYPSLFWLNCSDAAVAGFPALGALCGALTVIGGPLSPLFLLVSWLAMISIDGSIYPWDTLLAEAGFLTLWLPSTPSLGPLLVRGASESNFAALSAPASYAAVSLPSPLLSFAFRWLLFRVLVGFGKIKFTGAGWRDRLYIKGFVINQPMITAAGWVAFQLLPDSAWAVSLLGMFVIELIAPFFLFVSGAARVVAAGSIAALMVGIQVTGNYGYFNVLTIVMCVPALAHSDALSWTLADLLPPGVAFPPLTPAAVLPWLALHWRAAVIALVLLVYILPMSAIQLVMNSWVNGSWPHWSGIYRLRLHPLLWWTQAYARLHRSLMQFRVVSGYGVFPPQTSPPQRWAVCYEGSDDGVNWRRYALQYYLAGPKTTPAWVAPWHPRPDHAIFYESLSISGPIAIIFSCSPYSYHTSAGMWTRLLLRLLEGGASARAVFPFFSHNPFPDASRPPRFMRTVRCQFSPTSIAHWWRTGEFWHERPMGLHMPPVSLDSLARQQALPALSGSSAPGASPPRTLGCASLDTVWPLNDTSPLPEDYYCEFATWRARAGVTHTGVTPAEEAEAWAFLHDLRRAAADAADELAAVAAACSGSSGGGSSSDPNGTPGSTEPRGRSKSPSRSPRQRASRGGSSSRSSHRTPKASQSSSQSPSRALPSRSLSSAENVAATFVRLPLDAEALAAGAAAIRRTDVRARLPASASSSVLVWSVLPGAVSRARARYTAAHLVRIRTTLNRMAVPLVCAAERVFDRVHPTREELRAEGGGGDQCPVDYLDVANMALAPPAAVEGGSSGGSGSATAGARLPPCGPASPDGTPGLPIYYFAGNDDAATGGAMRNPMRWTMHAHRLMLVGGRGAYEAALRGLTGAPSVGPAPLSLSAHAAGGGGLLPSLTRSDVWTRLTLDGSMSPAHMSTEEGSFLLFTLGFDALTSAAVVNTFVLSQSRPAPSRSPPAPSFMPAFLELLPRILAHPTLRAVHASYAITAAAAAAAATTVSVGLKSASPAAGGATGSSSNPSGGGESGISTVWFTDDAGFVPIPALPLWTPTADESWWTYGGRRE